MICDYSHWNGVIDWNKAVSAGVIGAYLKASQGTTLTDSQFKRSAASCPLKYKGAYHFFDYWTGHYDVGDENGFGIRQANYFLNVIGDWKYTLPGALDIENNSGSGWEDLNKNIPRALKIVKGFVDRYKAVTGHYPVIYTSSYFTRYLTDFTDCPLWVAHYGVAKPVYYNWNEHALWQYSSEGDGEKYGNEAGNKYVDLNSIGIPLDRWAIGAQVAVYPENLVYPLPTGIRISQLFGERPNVYTTSKGHNGIDWACPVGTPIYAMQDGVVVRASDFSQPGITDGKVGYGRHVRIQHPEGVSIYGHLSKLMVKEGDRVNAGQQIGLSGGATNDPNSGMSTGPHLHAEYRLTSGAPQVPGGYAYGAIDILPLLVDADYQEGEALYKVRVKITNLLIRTGPGKTYPAVGGYASGVYEIFEEQNGYGRIAASRWISLDPAYVEKVPPTSEDEPLELTDKQKLDVLWAEYLKEHTA